MATQSKSVEPVDGADRRLLRIEEIAERLAVSRSMAWKLIAHGRAALGAHRTGRPGPTGGPRGVRGRRGPGRVGERRQRAERFEGPARWHDPTPSSERGARRARRGPLRRAAPRGRLEGADRAVEAVHARRARRSPSSTPGMVPGPASAWSVAPSRAASRCSSSRAVRSPRACSSPSSTPPSRPGSEPSSSASGPATRSGPRLVASTGWCACPAPGPTPCSRRDPRRPRRSPRSPLTGSRCSSRPVARAATRSSRRRRGPSIRPGGPGCSRRAASTSIATISDEEREALHALARLFDAMPPVTPRAPSAGRSPDGDRPGDRYDALPDPEGRIEDLLVRRGWTVVSRRGGTTYLRRPGKEQGISATLGHHPGLLIVFSTNTPFEATSASAPRGYGPFAVYTILEHDGDWAAAARALRRTQAPPPAPGGVGAAARGVARRGATSRKDRRSRVRGRGPR